MSCRNCFPEIHIRLLSVFLQVHRMQWMLGSACAERYGMTLYPVFSNSTFLEYWYPTDVDNIKSQGNNEHSMIMTGGSREHLSTVALGTAPSACEMAKDHLKVKFTVYGSLGNWKVS